MKRIHINIGQIALVYRKGNLQTVLRAGEHRVRFGQNVQVYATKDMVPAFTDMNVLLENPAFAQAVELVEVSDDQIALYYANGNFNQILRPGRHAFWKDFTEHAFYVVNVNEARVPDTLPKSALSLPALAVYLRTMVVAPYEKGVLHIDGKLDAILDAGTYYFWKNALTVSVDRVPLRTQVMEVTGQELLTKDKAALRLNVSVNYAVRDIPKAVSEVGDYAAQFYNRVQLAVRDAVGGRSLDELLEQKAGVSAEIESVLQRQAQTMGLEVLACGIKDIVLPGDMKEIMNQVLVAQKKAQANSIARREETAATRNLLNTAKLMEDNQMLMKLKEMEYVEKIADKINSISVSNGNEVLEQLRTLFVH